MPAKKTTPTATVAPKTKTFFHKEVIFSKEPGQTFEYLLQKALKSKKAVKERMQDGDDSGEKRFVNYHLLHGSEDGSMYGCEFIAYVSGSDQSVVQLAADADELNVDAVQAGPDREFLGGSVYFGVRGNHLIFFQSQALRSIELESYLNWLLRESTQMIDEGNYILLVDHVSKKARKTIKGVKGIRLKSPLVPAATGYEAPSEKTAEGKREEMTIVPAGNQWEALKSFFGNSIELPSRFLGKELTEIKDLEIEIYLKWKGNHGEADNEFLDKIGAQMRHVNDEFDYDIETKNGNISRDKLKNSRSFSVPWTDRGRPKFDVLFVKMATWLESLVTSGRVDP